MGYEVTAYIVRKSTQQQKLFEYNGEFRHVWEDNVGLFFYGEQSFNFFIEGAPKNYLSKTDDEIITRDWCKVLAMVELGKVRTSSVFPTKETSLYFYGTDGDTPIVRDKYGDFLKQTSLEEALRVLSDNPSEHGGSITVLYATLGGIEAVHGYDDIFVLFYGH